MSLLLNPQGFGRKRKGRKNLKQTSAYASKEDEEAAEELSAAILAGSLVVSFYLTSIIAFAYNYQQGWSVREAFYFGTATMTTVGFGDFYPTHRDSQNFTIFFAIWGVCVIAVGLQEIANFVERKRQMLVNATKKKMIEASASPQAAKLIQEQEEKERLAKRRSSFGASISAAIGNSFDSLSLDSFDRKHHKSSGRSPSPRTMDEESLQPLSPSVQISSSLPPPRPFYEDKDIVDIPKAVDNEDKIVRNKEEEDSKEAEWVKIVKSYQPLMTVFLRLVIYMFVTGVLFSYLEDWTIIDGLYYAVVTGCTVGYGDLYPTTSTGMWLANLWLPGSVIFVGAELGKLGSLAFASNEDDKLAQLMKTDMSLEALLAMDDDGDGEITEYEFLKFMLVSCELVDGEVLESIHHRFQKMDTDGSGSLSRDDIEDIVSHHLEPFGHHSTLKRKELSGKRHELKALMQSVPTRKIRLMESITEDAIRLANQNEPFLRSKSQSNIPKTPKSHLPSSTTTTQQPRKSQSLPPSRSKKPQNLDNMSSSRSKHSEENDKINKNNKLNHTNRKSQSFDRLNNDKNIVSRSSKSSGRSSPLKNSIDFEEEEFSPRSPSYSRSRGKDVQQRSSSKLQKSSSSSSSLLSSGSSSLSSSKLPSQNSSLKYPV